MKKNKWKTKKQNLLLTVIKNLMFCSIFIFLGVLYVWQHTQIVRIGLRIREKEIRLKTVEKENKKLELRIAMFTAPQNIERELKRHGLKMLMPKNEQIIYLSGQVLGK